MKKHLVLFYSQHKKAVLLAVAFFSFSAVLAVIPPLVQADISLRAIRDQEIQTKNQQIDYAILNNDYDLWRSLVTNEKLKEKVTRENFPQFAQSYRLLQEGKVEELDLIKKQIALKGDFEQTAEKSKMIDSAINSGDYNLWKQLVGSSRSNKVTEGQFGFFSQAYNFIQQGKLKAADLLKRKIDLKVQPDFSSSR